MNSKTVVILSITVIYFIAIIGIGYLNKKSATGGSSFTNGGKPFPSILIAALIVSEFIGTSVSIGTAQTGFKVGISAAWNLIALGIGFLLLGIFLVKKYRATKNITISGILAGYYGSNMRYASSILTMISLSIVAIALYASGGAVLSKVVGIEKWQAILACGAVAVLFVMIGGMRSVVYSNTLNVIIKYAGVMITLWFALKFVGGIEGMKKSLAPEMFDFTAIGWGQIGAWMFSGIGSIFATQYVIQGIAITKSDKDARKSCSYTFVLMVPFGLMVALIGMCSAVLYPSGQSIDAFPSIVANMPALPTSIVFIGLAGALFGGISAAIMSNATLFLNDFYIPFFNKENDERKSLICVRLATAFFGLLPLILALHADEILKIAFLGKSLRASLAIFILLAFYAPKFGTSRGAFYGIILSVILTITWFLLGNPYGIDSSYVAFVTPIFSMLVSHLMKGDHSLKQRKCDSALNKHTSRY